MNPSFGPTDPALRRRVGRWLAVWAVMVLLTVVVGGVTRLTESGLSITEWKPVSGVIPPIGETAWEEEFAKYQRIPEYREINAGMDLAGFKRIYWVEFVHRFWARIVGLAFAIPLAVFLVRGGLGSPLTRRLVGLLVLLGLQGFMGWWMVASGLTERTDVSQYRLAAHLGLALVIFGITVWTAADLLRTRGDPAAASSGLRRGLLGFLGLVSLTVLAGAFVAGLDAGHAYNTFPLMGGRLVPLGYFQMDPWWVNAFEHVTAVQFNHRVLGVLTALAALAVWWASRQATPGVRVLGMAVGLTGLAQAGLGIATLLLFVPIWLAALHQAGAVVLLGLALLMLHRLRPAEPLPGYSSEARSVAA